MKKYTISLSIITILSILLVIVNLSGCKKSENPIKYKFGTFPDSVYKLTGLNSQYDDYNSTFNILGSSIPIIFSSNRGSKGGQFDLVQGGLWFQFDQTTGAFSVGGEMTSDPFFAALINKANTSGNDLGPYSIYSSTDGYEYLFVASENGNKSLDLYFLKNLPRFGSAIPEILGPFNVKLLNSSADDAYISLDTNEDTAYFTSNRDGNFDIYLHKRASGVSLDSWFSQNFEASAKVDSVNSSYDDKCPFFYQNIMLFSSDRTAPGAMGGFDLYYSIFKKGNWSTPVNMGPRINSAYDEYRPLLGYHPDFTNMFMIFSSNKPGGSGGFDLYFTSVDFSKK
jgi:hypothetical protein